MRLFAAPAHVGLWHYLVIGLCVGLCPQLVGADIRA